MIFFDQDAILERCSLSLDCSTDASLELHIRVVSSAYIIVLQLTVLKLIYKDNG